MKTLRITFAAALGLCAFTACLENYSGSITDSITDCTENEDCPAGQICDPINQFCIGDNSNRQGYPGFGVDPWGMEQGDVIEPLDFVDSDGEPFSLRDVYANGRNKVLLLTTSAGWCTACIEEQASLETLYGEYNERGIEIMVTVFQNANYAPADSNFANQWKRRYRLSYPVVADTDFLMQDYYPGRDPSVTPIMLVIDVPSMTILERFVGYDDLVIRSLIDRQLTGSTQ